MHEERPRKERGERKPMTERKGGRNRDRERRIHASKETADA